MILWFGQTPEVRYGKMIHCERERKFRNLHLLAQTYKQTHR